MVSKDFQRQRSTCKAVASVTSLVRWVSSSSYSTFARIRSNSILSKILLACETKEIAQYFEKTAGSPFRERRSSFASPRAIGPYSKLLRLSCATLSSPYHHLAWEESVRRLPGRGIKHRRGLVVDGCRWWIICNFSPSLTWPRRSLVIWTSLWRGRSGLFIL